MPLRANKKSSVPFDPADAGDVAEWTWGYGVISIPPPPKGSGAALKEKGWRVAREADLEVNE